MHSPDYLIVPLLEAFYWFDEGLQNYLRQQGWSEVTRPQSMIMVNVVMGVTKPSEIARRLGISRQAVHATIEQMVAMDLLTLEHDPTDRRAKVIGISKRGRRRRQDAQTAMKHLTRELARRIGSQNIQNLTAAFAENWGAPLVEFPKPAQKSRS
ncbi:MAG: MarR family winged helix-turn-helix transcriptional regulator [Rhizomicrobium sp.]